MKTHLFILLLLIAALKAHPQSAGRITYEVVRKIDPSGMRIVINGEQVKPGDPNFPSDIPDTRTFGQKVFFAGNYAREDRDEQNMMVRRVMDGPGTGGAPQSTNLGRPFDEQTIIDFQAQKILTFLTVGKEKDAVTYKTEVPIEPVSDWQITDQTRKIAGYVCRKATVRYRNEPYAVWFTAELPFRYAPVPALTPEKGVALLIEGTREQYKATKVSLEAVDPTLVQPGTQAETVTKARLDDIRQKAMADFQQKMMTGEGN